MRYTLAQGLFSGLLCMALLTGCQSGRALEPTAQRLGVYHKVQPGQTLWSIAQAYGVDVHVLARVNDLADTDVLSVGQHLYIPGAVKQLQVASRCPCASETETPKPRAGISTRVSPPPTPPQRQQATTRTARFMWPLRGTVTREFRQGGEKQHDGIDIAAPKATPIRASADGKVIFSDWGPGGYGRVVILRHEGDLITVYAHNHDNLVRAGQTVRQGDLIATVGKSGRASGYHLHFEIRRKTVPVSPFQFISDDRHLAQVGRE